MARKSKSQSYLDVFGAVVDGVVGVMNVAVAGVVVAAAAVGVVVAWSWGVMSCAQTGGSFGT